MVKVKTTGTDPNKSDSQYLDTEGRYHLVVDTCKQVTGEYGEQFEANFRILSGTEESQVDRTTREYFSLEGKDGKGPTALLVFACAVGLYSREQWDIDKETGDGPDVEAEDFEGLQLCGESRTKTSKKGTDYQTLGLRLWHVNSEEAKDIPKDAEMLALAEDEGEGDAPEPTTASAGGNGSGRFSSF